MRESYRKVNKRVECMLTMEMFNKLKQTAKKYWITPTAFLRQSALAYIDNDPVKPKEVEQKLQKAIFLLSNIANNINQIAKNTNRRQKAKLFELTQAKKYLFELEEWLENILQNDNKIHE